LSFGADHTDVKIAAPPTVLPFNRLIEQRDDDDERGGTRPCGENFILMSFYIKIIQSVSWRTTSNFNIKQIRPFFGLFHMQLHIFVGRVESNMH
jgi:hypothetical protein